MAISTLFKHRPPEVEPVFSASRLPATSDDIVSSSYDNAMKNNRFVSEMNGERASQDKLYEPRLAQEEAENPDFDRTAIHQNAQQYYALKKSAALGDRYARDDREAYYAAMADRFEDGVPSMEEVRGDAATTATEAYSTLQSDLQHSISDSPKWSLIKGEIGAALSDPVQIAALVASSPIALSTRVLATAAIEGSINAAIDVPLLLTQQDWYKKQGRELTSEEMANQLVMSVGIGAVFGTVLSGTYKALGGKNTLFIPRPGLESKRVGTGYVHKYGVGQTTERPAWMTSADVAAERQRSADMDDLRRQVIESGDAPTGPYTHDTSLGTSYAEGGGGLENPFKQTEDMGAIGNTYTLIEGEKKLPRMIEPTSRHQVLGIIDSDTAKMAQPYRFAPKTPHDNYTVTWRGEKLAEEHAENVKEAVLALNAGDTPTVPQKTALTVEMTLDDSSARIADLKDMESGNVTLSMKSKPYRTFLNKVIREVMTPRLREQVSTMSKHFTADRAPLKPEVARPTRTLKQLDETQNKILDDEIQVAFKRKKLDEEKAAGHAFAKKYDEAALAGDELPTRPKDVRTLKAIEAAEKKLDAQQAKLKERNVAADNDVAKWRDYDVEVERVGSINDAMIAEKTLADLDEGKLPTVLQPLRERLDETYQGMKGQSGIREDAVLAGAKLKVEQRLDLGKGRRGTAFTPDKAFELDSVVRILGDSEAEREINSMYGEMTRMDGDFQFTVLDADGAPITRTVAQEKKLLDDLDEAVEATKTCAYGGPAL